MILEKIALYNITWLKDNAHLFSQHQELLDRYLEIANFYQTVSLFDRTETLPHFLPIVNLTKPCFHNNSNKTFREIVYERGLYLMSFNKPICVFWSGGIDSTLVLSSLLSLGAKPEVYFTYDSVGEYPWFFNRVILEQKLIQHQYFNADFRPFVDLNQDKIFVSGEPGDQLIGSMITPQMIANNFNGDEYWRDKMPEKTQEFLHPLIDKIGFPVRTLNECYWLLNFTMKWQEILVRFPVYMKGLEKEENRKKIHHFYASQEFQNWALYKHSDKRIAKDPTYKMEFKDIIYEYTNDSEYREKKNKQPSLRLIRWHQYKFVTEEGMIIN